jgi:hypothetical protein
MPLTFDEVGKLEKVTGQLESILREINTLARKSPNDGVNKFKLKFINTSLRDANDILGEQYQPIEEFERMIYRLTVMWSL